MMGESTTLRFGRDGHVATLVLDRADRLNAFTAEMWAEMRALGRTLLAEPGDVRVLVVRGEGRAFSSGIDTALFAGDLVSALRDPANPRHRVPAIDAVLTTQDAFTWLTDAPFVTIAAVHGFALGAGLQLALACDIRVVARSTTLGLLEVGYGIIPDLGGTQRLPRLVGTGKAIELIATAARVDADEALRIGMVERVVDDDGLTAAVSALAASIAAQPPGAVAGAKRAVHAALDGRSVREGLLLEAEIQATRLRELGATES
jgi:enoyl-CoA hydratase/carnithine racemase